MIERIGVGFVGAGGVVQAIHLPTLARLQDRFRTVAVWDVQPPLAQAVAEIAGAKAHSSLDALLADPAVDVVAVCTPPPFHADQVIAAMRAGKRAILCEKPLAATVAEAECIAVVAAETGVPLVVGSMHIYDPALRSAGSALAKLAAEAHTIRSSMTLPSNSHIEQWVFEAVPRPVDAPPRSAPSGDRRIWMVRDGIMELAIHDLPIVRMFVPEGEQANVTDVATFGPIGYAITLRAGDRLIELFAHMGKHWQPRWTFEAMSETMVLQIEFTPSFVHAGSGVTTISRDGRSIVHHPQMHNGYEGEWLAIAATLAGKQGKIATADTLVADVKFAIDIACQSCALVEGRIAA
ncbi:Predicted dehydrogenase [Sphingomonas sp. YR710]|jgi:predicted dehydrogenase|uniref:Gfo/Idh/MocA family protein n=1 Tax=Sphingomonas sp. YR710 TaxID=1882773 RepID=UPI0008849DF1|nr:Gfo/Idh/MocA family oxidoreductase [Sphingomonas sp. YR710]SDD81741.1 Predicted dehydrogenase [Sphingomonas sp. YR710]